MLRFNDISEGEVLLLIVITSILKAGQWSAFFDEKFPNFVHHLKLLISIDVVQSQKL